MIYRATVDDLVDPAWRNDVEQLAYDFFHEAKLPGKFTPARFFEAWRSYLLAGIGVLLYADREKAVSGVIGGVLSQSAVTGDILLSEAFWFVKPFYRGNGADGIRLLKTFMEVAKELKVDHVTMAHMAFGDVGTIYERFGFRKLETHYIVSL